MASKSQASLVSLEDDTTVAKLPSKQQVLISYWHVQLKEDSYYYHCGKIEFWNRATLRHHKTVCIVARFKEEYKLQVRHTTQMKNFIADFNDICTTNEVKEEIQTPKSEGEVEIMK